MVEAVVEIAKLMSVGFLSAVFVSFLTNRDHRRQRYWEIRVAAYQAVIEALSDLLYYYDVHYNAELERRDLPEELKVKLSSHWNEALPKVRRAADSGAFIFSDDVNQALRQLLRKDYEAQWFEYLDNNLAKCRECLSVIVGKSKSDLAV